MRPLTWPVTTLLSLYALTAVASGWAAEGLAWHDSFQAAQAASAESGRPIMVVFRSAGCDPCAEFESVTLAAPSVVELARRFEVVPVNALLEPEIANRYLVSAFPTVKFLDADGTVVYDSQGLLGAAAFVEVMQRALAGHAALLRARQAAAEAADPPSPKLAVAIARDFALARQYADAADWARRALEEISEDGADVRAEALFIRGRSLVEMGEPYDAIDALTAYLQTAPVGDDVWRARVALGYAWVQSGANEAGAQLLRAVVEAEDAPMPARAEAGRLLQWAGAEAN